MDEQSKKDTKEEKWGLKRKRKAEKKKKTKEKKKEKKKKRPVLATVAIVGI